MISFFPVLVHEIHVQATKTLVSHPAELLLVAGK